jgi:hypothetical protein
MVCQNAYCYAAFASVFLSQDKNNSIACAVHTCKTFEEMVLQIRSLDQLVMHQGGKTASI